MQNLSEKKILSFFSFSSRISKAGVITIVLHCPKLKTLDIANQQFKARFIEYLDKMQLKICYKGSMPPPSRSASNSSETDFFEGIVLGMSVQ